MDDAQRRRHPIVFLELLRFRPEQYADQIFFWMKRLGTTGGSTDSLQLRKQQLPAYTG